MIGRRVARRTAWKLGRRLYMHARGEPRTNLTETSGEAYVQRQVVLNAGSDTEMVVFDIGANVGGWTAQFLHLYRNLRKGAPEDVRIFAFEPVPATREKLLSAIEGLPERRRIQIIPVALSDRAGSARMEILGGVTSGRNSLETESTRRDPSRERIVVETATLDGFCEANAITNAVLVKCDAEGHDAAVLSGAFRMLSEQRIDVFQFEYTKRWIDNRRFLKDVFELLERLPYTVARILPKRIEPYAEWHPELERFFSANYVVVHARALGWFELAHGRFDASNTYA